MIKNYGTAVRLWRPFLCLSVYSGPLSKRYNQTQ